MENPKAVLIGCGQWGRNIGRNLHSLGALAAVVDPDLEKLDFARENFKPAALFREAGEVLRSDSVEAVCIATPAVTHASLAMEALACGKDVFIEKPLALGVEEGREVVREAERRSRILMVGHLLRYHPAVAKLKQLVDSGKLGAIRYIYSQRLNLGRVRREENILWSFAPHDIDVIMLLAGRMPRRVIAVGASYLQPRVADTTLSYMFFDSDLGAHIYVSWLHPFKDQRLVVIGSEAMAVFDDVRRKDKLVVHNGKFEIESGKPVLVNQSPALPVAVEEREPLLIEMEHFLECVRTRQNPVTDGRSGLRVVAVLQACQGSMARGGETEEVAPI